MNLKIFACSGFKFVLISYYILCKVFKRAKAFSKVFLRTLYLFWKNIFEGGNV